MDATIAEALNLGKARALHRALTASGEADGIPTLVLEKLSLASNTEAQRLPAVQNPPKRRPITDEEKDDTTNTNQLSPYQCDCAISWVCGEDGLTLLRQELEDVIALVDADVRVQVGIDTEWGDEATGGYAGPSIVQLAVGKRAWVIDTSEPSATIRLFFSWLFQNDRFQFLGFAFAHDTQKLAAMMQGDVEGVVSGPRHLVDLQKIAMSDDRSHTPSLKHVVAEWLELDLDKTEQCSEWERRPLSTSQVEYAAADAAILIDLAVALGVDARI